MTLTTSEALNLTADLKFERALNGYVVRHNGSVIGSVWQSGETKRWSGARVGGKTLSLSFRTRKTVAHWLAVN